VCAVKDLLEQDELDLAVACLKQIKEGQPVAAEDEARILALMAEVQSDADERIAEVVERCTSDDGVVNEHPTYTRAEWPRTSEPGVPDTAYWCWVLQRIESNGGLGEHCDRCCAQLDGEGCNGLCGDCADKAGL
jgi:hypothetical protein